MQGVEPELTLAQLEPGRPSPGHRFRAKPPGVVVGPVGSGRLHLAADYALYRDLTPLPKKFTVTSPYMLAKTWPMSITAASTELVLALADVLADSSRPIDAQVLQVDEANVTGHPDDGPIAAAAINRVLAAACGREGRAPVLRQLRRANDPEGNLRGELLAFLNSSEATTWCWKSPAGRRRICPG